jgi:MYXO-CTERM domain-containing protein
LSGPNYFTVLTPATVPEPSATTALLGAAILLITATRRRRL